MLHIVIVPAKGWQVTHPLFGVMRVHVLKDKPLYRSVPPFHRIRPRLVRRIADPLDFLLFEKVLKLWSDKGGTVVTQQARNFEVGFVFENDFEGVCGSGGGLIFGRNSPQVTGVDVRACEDVLVSFVRCGFEVDKVTREEAGLLVEERLDRLNQVRLEYPPYLRATIRYD